jgi:hypothetical protein
MPQDIVAKGLNGSALSVESDRAQLAQSFAKNLAVATFISRARARKMSHFPPSTAKRASELIVYARRYLILPGRPC